MLGGGTGQWKRAAERARLREGAHGPPGPWRKLAPLFGPICCLRGGRRPHRKELAKEAGTKVPLNLNHAKHERKQAHLPVRSKFLRGNPLGLVGGQNACTRQDITTERTSVATAPALLRRPGSTRDGPALET